MRVTVTAGAISTASGYNGGPSAAPEPAAAVLMFVGLAVRGLRRRRS